MTTQPQLPFTSQRIQAARLSKRKLIEHYFEAHLGIRKASWFLHSMFGSSFRTRVSDINRDPQATITIRNEVTFVESQEQSTYWSEKR